MPWQSRTQHSAPQGSPDVWTKADVVAKLLSSVVIAAIGLLVTCSMQTSQIATSQAIANAQVSANQAIAKAQLEAARAKAVDDRRLQEGALSVQLLNYLVSEKPAQRRIAIIALRRAVPTDTYDEVVAVLAENDPVPEVRAAAINQLAASTRPQTAFSLASIARAAKSPEERATASRASDRVTYSVLSSGNQAVFGASRVNSRSYESDQLRSGVFSYFVMRGLEGAADKDEDGNVRVDELSEYLRREVPQFTEKTFQVSQEPFFIQTGDIGRATVLSTAEINDTTSAVLIGVTNYGKSQNRSLNYAAVDANNLASLLKSRGVTTETLVNSQATRANISLAIRRVLANARENSTVIVFYSGYSILNMSTGSNWVAYDSSPDDEFTLLNVNDIRRTLEQTKAKNVLLLIDACDVEVRSGSINASSEH